MPIETENLILKLNASEDIPAPDVRLTVKKIRVTGDAGTTEVEVEVSVAESAPERWAVRLPTDPELLEPDVLPQTFVAVIRANLDEWWLTKADEPAVATLGRRISS